MCMRGLAWKKQWQCCCSVMYSCRGTWAGMLGHAEASVVMGQLGVLRGSCKVTGRQVSCTTGV